MAPPESSPQLPIHVGPVLCRLPEPPALGAAEDDAAKGSTLAFTAAETPAPKKHPLPSPPPWQTAPAPTRRKETLPLQLGERRSGSSGTRQIIVKLPARISS